MGDPLSLAAIGWGLTATGWLVSPCISIILNKAYEHIKHGRSRDKIRSLVTETVPRLKLLIEAAEGSDHKDLFGELLRDLRSALDTTEEILDKVEYARREGKQQKSGTKRKSASSIGEGSSNQAVGTLSDFTIPGPLSNLLKENVTTIEKLLEKARETIKTENLQIKQGSGKCTPNVTDVKMPTISVSTVEVTGREKVLEEITEMLRQTEDNKPFSVIGIIGIPGSGKTTLAQCVCKSERNAGYFDLVMWIHVSESYNVHSIYSEMFEQAYKKNRKRPEYNSTEMLRQELEKLLKGKQFLLVLDDIWFNAAGEQKLQELLIPLWEGKEGSKILVTSRQDSLSRLGRNVPTIKIEIPDLDDEVFLKLFMHYALDDKPISKKYAVKLKSIGAQIAENLKKSPLLARVVGGILLQKPRIEVRDWISIRDQNLSDKYMGALWWSYLHLGEEVRRCFSYCSIFPRRHHLHRDELVNLWVAEGFINTTNERQEMEDVGRDYFNKLLSTSFLLRGGNETDGKEYFLIHDLLYDLAVKVSGDDCYKIENPEMIYTEKVPPDVRHLSVRHCTASLITKHIVKLKRLRTLIIYGIEHDIDIDNMFSQLSKLRVLIFGTEAHPICRRLSFQEHIGCLKHLRYLGLVTKGGLTLPGTIDKLYLLQVLAYGPDEMGLSFGEHMIKLVDLRHVISKIEPLRFPNIGKMISLKTIPPLCVGYGEGYELHQLKHLNKLQGKLEIRDLEFIDSKEEALDARLADKEELMELELSWDILHTDCDEDMQIQADILEVLCPPNIESLSITRYFCSRYPRWMVDKQKIPMHLDKLKLNYCSQPTAGPEFYFINVTSLVLSYCEWHILPYNMDILTSLEVVSCSRFPSNLEHFSSIKTLIIRDNDTEDTLLTLPRFLDYIELDNCVFDFEYPNRQNWDRIKDIPHKVIDGCTVDHTSFYEFEEFDTENRGL